MNADKAIRADKDITNKGIKTGNDIITGYSVVIPVFNGGKTVKELTLRLERVFERLGETFEIIFVDDNSSDNSWAELEALAGKDQRIKAVRLAANSGQHSATVCGMSFAGGRWVITMDDDLQHSPEDIPILIERMKETGCRVIIARLAGKKHLWYRRWASHFVRILAQAVINKPPGLYLSSFRLIERQVVGQMLALNYSCPYVPALIFRVTGDAANVEIPHRERKYGSSAYTVPKMIKLAGRLFLNNPGIQRLGMCTGPACIIAKTVNLGEPGGIE
ncbi:MAG: glycosyltransferase [Firmicutes bacterium HGW-Firmicutes-14]|nr:MAG: glycosyltransferase [Firmicutes bacterium HGW-Firmicutes-14]